MLFCAGQIPFYGYIPVNYRDNDVFSSSYGVKHIRPTASVKDTMTLNYFFPFFYPFA